MSTRMCQSCGNGFLAPYPDEQYCLRCRIEMWAEAQDISYEEAEEEFENFGKEVTE